MGFGRTQLRTTRGRCRATEPWSIAGRIWQERRTGCARPPCKPFVLHHNGSIRPAAYNSNHKGEPIWLRCRISFLAFGSTAKLWRRLSYTSRLSPTRTSVRFSGRRLIRLGPKKATRSRSNSLWQASNSRHCCGRKGAPNVVIEVTIASTREVDLKDKFELHRDIVRVAEYSLFDPRGEYLSPALQGYRLTSGEYAPIEPGSGRRPSVELGLELEDGRGATSVLRSGQQPLPADPQRGPRSQGTDGRGRARRGRG